jgi:hypothetical protein
MTKTTRLLQLLAPACGVLLAAGCGSQSSTSENVVIPVATTQSGPPPTAEPVTSERSSTASPVKPPKGFGNAQGRVLWNEKGAPGIEVRLCENISFIGGCTGKTYSAKTDKDGNYTIDKVPPGEYGLAVRIFNTDGFLYPTTGILTAARHKIEADKTLDIRATNLFKTDLQVISPKAGDVVKTGLPKLTWKAYPEAASYEISVTSANGGSPQTVKSASTSATPGEPLLNGGYTWKVVAKNPNGVKIAETNDDIPFKVTGQLGSSTVTLTYPKTGAAVPGANLTFTWEKHPLADGYQIYLNPSDNSGTVLSFVNVDTNSYKLDKTLPAGQYDWSINAMKDGNKIAASVLQNFRVK